MAENGKLLKRPWNGKENQESNRKIRSFLEKYCQSIGKVSRKYQYSPGKILEKSGKLMGNFQDIA